MSSSRLFAEDGGPRDPGVNVDWPREHGAAAFASALENPARLLLVAVHGGEVVGHLSGSLTEPSAMRPVRSAALMAMYVWPEHRGSGVGARLAEAFFVWARECGAEQAEVTAYSANSDAIRFYGREGFRPSSLTLRRAL